MPNPNDYKTKEAFMSACVKEVKGEGKKKDQAVAVCLSKWSKKGK